MTFSLTDRQVTGIQSEANRLGVTSADVLRRLIDSWLDRPQRAIVDRPLIHVADRA